MRDTSQPVPFVPATRAVFDLSLEGMIWSRRSLLMGLLVGVPLIVAVVYRVLLAAEVLPSAAPPLDLYGFAVAIIWVRNLLPLMALFHATSLIADEVEGRTLTYLLTRPLTRPAIFAGKFAAYLATSLGIALPSAVLTFFLLVTARGWSGVGASVPDLLRDLGVMTLTVLAYGALFALLGVLLRRPVIPGLLFLFGWELMANLPGYLPRLTLTAYLRSLIHHRPAQEGLAGLFNQVQPVGLSLAVVLATTTLFLGAAAWLFSEREYVLEQ
ncbi:MAG: ABC transporter permease [Acidobacteriota bacterium]|jgi:ABC-type transport system involved in multi-copper enzyme maturation permease subunit